MQDAPPSGRSPLERPLVRAAVAVVLLAALGGVVLLVQSQRAGSDSGPVSFAGTPASPAATEEAGLGPLDSQKPIKGQPAPDFVLRNADGQLVKLSDLRGKVVWVNFWASWCVPCKKELPDIQKIYDEKHGDGLEVLAVNWQEDIETARAFFSSLNLHLPLLLDGSGGVYTQYRLQGLPDSFFIARDGTLSAFQFGFLTEAKMRERLATAGLP